ncbi:YgaP family membrane protein [Chthoniobacter flavus]
MNISDNERIVSGLVGAILVGVALVGGRIGKLLLVAAGVALVQRGMRGQCEWYRQLGVDRRHVKG